MIDDHKNSIAHFQEQSEKSRELDKSYHQTEADDLKARIDSITADLTSKLNIAESKIQELFTTHQENLATLTTEKDALISAAEVSKANREKEMQDEINALIDAMQATNNRIIVVPLVTVLKVGNTRNSRC